MFSMAIQDEDHGVVKDMSEIGAVGHRVVHAGEKFAHSVLIDDACDQGSGRMYRSGSAPQSA